MKKLFLLVYTTLLLSLGFTLSAQQFFLQGANNNNGPGNIPPGAIAPQITDNLQLAISSKDYPVTPGDVYTLTFLMANQTVANTLLVESDYTINMTIFGKLNARGMTFAELKPVIEQKIADAYPRSLPSVTITTVGVFQVPITGEIPQAVYVTAWGMSKLSEIIEGNLGYYSSIRDITIIPETGRARKYDLLKAISLGILSEDPNISPGDTVVISRVSRQIEVRGEIYRPAVYQLLPEEGLADIYSFTGGYTPMANLSRIRIDRFSEGIPVTLNINKEQINSNFNLLDGDIITVSSIIQRRPVVYIEGGVETDQQPAGIQPLQVDPNAQDINYNRIVQQINQGETLYDVLYSIKDSISPFSDLSNGYLIRQDEQNPIAVNMQKLLYDYNKGDDIVLKPFDHITIPLKRPLISVIGAANNPGRFPFIPKEDYKYYISLAGGFDTLRNTGGKVIITDKDGKRKKSLDILSDGDIVNVLSNSFLYNFNQYFPAIATGLGLITTIITLTALLNQTGAP